MHGNTLLLHHHHVKSYDPANHDILYQSDYYQEEQVFHALPHSQADLVLT